MNLTLMIGIPGCGKSTYVNEYFYDTQIICLDDIRLALGSIYDDKTELFARATANTIIRANMLRGNDIVVDATNLQIPIMENYRKMCNEFNYCMYGRFFNTPKTICYERRVKKGFPENVFSRMYDDYEKLLKEDSWKKLFDEIQIAFTHC